MDNNTRNEKKQDTVAKKPYSKPVIESEKIYEQDVLACGKLPGGCGPVGSSA